MGVEISVDGEEESTEEDVLRQIYDLLAAHFEGGKEEVDDIEDEDLEGGEDEGGEEDEEEEDMDEEEGLEELSNHGVGKPAAKSAGKDAGYTAVKEGKGALQERFQKLANII